MNNTVAPPSPIRHATSRDVIGISNCVSAAYQHYIERIGQPPGPMLDDYAAIIPMHTVYVTDGLVGNGEPDIVGVLVLMESANYFLLDNIAVHPCCQGRGIGRQLMTLAEAVAKERGYQSIRLYTHELMRENIALYAKHGYVETERRIERGFPRVYMQKELAAV